MPSIKLECCGPSGYHIPDEFHARVPSLLILFAVHTCIGVFRTYVQFVKLLCAFVGICD